MSIHPEDPPAEAAEPTYVEPETAPAPAQTGIIRHAQTGAVFAWLDESGQPHIPKNGDPDAPAFMKAVLEWAGQENMIYRSSPTFAAAQAGESDPVTFAAQMSSGVLPGIGYIATPGNSWGLPAGAKVLNIEQGSEGYQIDIDSTLVGATAQDVHIRGPGYELETMVLARTPEEAAARAKPTVYINGFLDQTGITGVSQAGGEVIVQKGAPEVNEFWVSRGLPQFANYNIPELAPEQIEQGNYIKNITIGADLTPQIEVGNRPNEDFWNGVGLPQYANKFNIPGLEPEHVAHGDYIAGYIAGEAGPEVIVQNRNNEAFWEGVGLPQFANKFEIPASLSADMINQGFYQDIQAGESGPVIQVGNRGWESAWGELGISDVNLIKGFAPPELPNEFATIREVTRGPEGLQVSFNTPDMFAPNLPRWTDFGLTPGSGPSVVRPSYPAGFVGPRLANTLTPPQVQPPNMSSLMPRDPSTIAFQEGEHLWVDTDFNAVASSKVNVNGIETTTYSLTPKPTGAREVNLASPLNQGVLGPGANVFGGTGAFGVQPLINTPEKATFALGVMGSIILPVIGPSIAAGAGATLTGGQIVTAGLAQVGISQAFNAASGQGLLSPTEAVSAMALGEGLGVAGPMINSALGIAGPGLTSAAARIGVYSAMGGGLSAGQEFIETGQVTPTNVAIGAAAGAAFGAVGEGIGAGINRLTPGVQTRINESFLSTEPGNIWQPSVTERISMGVFGVKPNVGRGTVGTAGDINAGLMDQGFIKPSEPGLTSAERVTLANATGIRPGEAMPDDFLTGFVKPPAEKLTPAAAAEQRLMANSVLGADRDGPMPLDFMTSFNKSPPGSARAGELLAAEKLASTPEGKSLANLYSRATSQVPNEPMSFGVEKPWSAPANNARPLRANELPNPVSAALNDLAWDLSIAPGSSTIMVPKPGSSSSGGSSYRVSPVETLGSSSGVQALDFTQNLQQVTQQAFTPAVPELPAAAAGKAPVVLDSPAPSVSQLTQPALVPMTVNFSEPATVQENKPPALIMMPTFPWGPQKPRRQEEELLVPMSLPPGVQGPVAPTLVSINLPGQHNPNSHRPSTILFNVPGHVQPVIDSVNYLHSIDHKPVNIPGGSQGQGNGLFQIGGPGQDIVQVPGQGHGHGIGQGLTNIPGIGQGQGIGLGQGNMHGQGLNLNQVPMTAQTLKLEQITPPGLELHKIQSSAHPEPYRMRNHNIHVPGAPPMDFSMPARRPKAPTIDLFGSLKRVHPIAEPGVWFSGPGPKRRKSRR